jgi:nitrogen regulatory protein P-II 1
VKRIEAIVRPELLHKVQDALETAGYGGFTISDVRGHGQQTSERGAWRGEEFELHVTHKILLTVFCEDDETPFVVERLLEAARTGNVGDGIVTVSEVLAAYLTRTGERAWA